MIKFKQFLSEAIAVDKVSLEKGKENVSIMMGRFQPPTLAHIDIIEKAYKKTKNKIAIFIVKSKNEKSPFKVSTIKKIFKAALKAKFVLYEIDNGFIGEAINDLRNDNLEPTEIVCGADREKSYEGQLKRYKEKLNLEITVETIPRTDEDVSASKVREALSNDDEEIFAKMMHKNTVKFFGELKRELK